MNIKLIVNPRAGGGKGREAGHKAEQFLCDRGVQYSLDSTFKPGGAGSLSKKAVDDGFDLIAAVGGDGMVNEIANGIAGSKASLAVIPAGCQNNFARSLGLDPDDIQAAVDTALHGKTIKADAGTVGGRYFLNDLEIMPDSRNAPSMLRVQMDKVELYSPAFMVVITNGRFFSKGLETTPGARIDDGLLDISLFNFAGKLGQLRYGRQIFNGRHNGHYPVTSFRAKRISVESPDSLRSSCDGEKLDIKARYEICVSKVKIPVKTK